MKKVLCLILVMYSAGVFAQKCDYFKNEKGKFTGKKTVITEKSQLFKEFTKQAYISFALSEDTLVVVLGYVEASPQSFQSDLSSELWLSLADETVLKLKPFESYQGRVRQVGGTMESVFQPQYQITKDQIEKLSKTGITAFRMGYTGGAIQKDVEAKNQKKIMASANCLLQGL